MGLHLNKDFTLKFIKQLLTSLTIIRQIRRGEWTFESEYIEIFDYYPTCFRATRGSLSLYLALGPKHCKIENDPTALGKFGVLVWYLAAKKIVNDIEYGRTYGDLVSSSVNEHIECSQIRVESEESDFSSNTESVTELSDTSVK